MLGSRVKGLQFGRYDSIDCEIHTLVFVGEIQCTKDKLPGTTKNNAMYLDFEQMSSYHNVMTH